VRACAIAALLVAIAAPPTAARQATPTGAIPGVTFAAGECFVLQAPDGREWAAPGDECDRQTAPASTFKIPHALLALQTGVVTPATVVPWDGTPYENAAWRRAHTLASAIRWSVFPFFQKTAAAIGRERMQQGLRAIGYGRDSYEGEQTTFWTNGDLLISPREQVAFLRRMVGGDLPIDPAHVAVVAAALVMPKGRITNATGTHPFRPGWPAGTVVRAKTGNALVDGERVSWLVGSLTIGRRDYVFASRVRAVGTFDSTAGARLAERCLNALASLARRRATTQQGDRSRWQ
jgi:beta-lactamase class D